MHRPLSDLDDLKQLLSELKVTVTSGASYQALFNANKPTIERFLNGFFEYPLARTVNMKSYCRWAKHFCKLDPKQAGHFLILAIQENCLDLVRVLVSHGADLAVTNHGYSALTMAQAVDKEKGTTYTQIINAALSKTKTPVSFQPSRSAIVANNICATSATLAPPEQPSEFKSSPSPVIKTDGLMSRMMGMTLSS